MLTIQNSRMLLSLRPFLLLLALLAESILLWITSVGSHLDQSGHISSGGMISTDFLFFFTVFDFLSFFSKYHFFIVLNSELRSSVKGYYNAVTVVSLSTLQMLSTVFTKASSMCSSLKLGRHIRYKLKVIEQAAQNDLVTCKKVSLWLRLTTPRPRGHSKKRGY